VVQVSVGASDNVGVVGVAASYGQGLPGSPVALQFDQFNGDWVGNIGPFTSPPTGSSIVTVTLTARDAAGNTAQTSFTFTLNSCLI